MADEKELTITHDFDAPHEVIWKAWTDPDVFIQWREPKDFITPVSKIDLRVGGEYFN
jgi:uncharacterized protein YndB with AHSA1/START domain